MTVGTLTLKLVIRDALSLKDKRRVVKSLKDIIRNRHNVSVAEVASQDNRQHAVLGIAMVGTDAQYVDGGLAKIVDLVRLHPVAQLVDYEVEIY
ncbi:MAG TPA: DUF503 domain-containing protein [Planctomycetota bacterium]|nr:DUF503 domain-containing protein [Planctomycetota bacterium]